MWYKVEIICMEKWKKNCIIMNFFYLNNNKNLLLWYKKRESENILKLIIFEKNKNKGEKWVVGCEHHDYICLHESVTCAIWNKYHAY
jgi:hypothetical protein